MLYAKTSTLIGDELIWQPHKQKDRLAAVGHKNLFAETFSFGEKRFAKLQ